MHRICEKSLVHSGHWFTGSHWFTRLLQWQQWHNGAVFRVKSHWFTGARQWGLQVIEIYRKSHWFTSLPKGRRSTAPVTPPIGRASYKRNAQYRDRRRRFQKKSFTPPIRILQMYANADRRESSYPALEDRTPLPKRRHRAGASSKRKANHPAACTKKNINKIQFRPQHFF